jgi:hypothetical protein
VSKFNKSLDPIQELCLVMVAKRPAAGRQIRDEAFLNYGRYFANDWILRMTAR